MTEQPGSHIEDPGEGTAYPSATDDGTGSVPEATGDYRDELRSRRWNAAPLENPEAEKTDPRIAVAAIVAFCVLTFVVLVVGYGVLGIWDLA